MFRDRAGGSGNNSCLWVLSQPLGSRAHRHSEGLRQVQDSFSTCQAAEQRHFETSGKGGLEAAEVIKPDCASLHPTLTQEERR